MNRATYTDFLTIGRLNCTPWTNRAPISLEKTLIKDRYMGPWGVLSLFRKWEGVVVVRMYNMFLN